MAHSLIWLPDVLKAAGLKVALVDGWETRSRTDVGQILGVLCNHTAGPQNGNMPSLNTLIKGRPDVPGPLAQLGLGRDGTFFVIAAGKCNHAGKGSLEVEINGIKKVVTTGNTNFIGIEAENSGGLDQFPWPEVQMDAYQRGVAAILKHIGLGTNCCGAHKEYAPARKPNDPRFNMNVFRLNVAAIMNGTTPPPIPIPATEPPAQPGAPAGRPTLRRGATGDLVKQVQAKVGVKVDGNFGPKTEAAVRVFQRAHGMVPDGIVGPRTWAALDGEAALGAAATD